MSLSFFSMLPPHPRSTLFPYTTLFRSVRYGCDRDPLRRRRLRRRPRHGLVSPYQSARPGREDRKSTGLNSSHLGISYAVFCLKKKKQKTNNTITIKDNDTQDCKTYRAH